MKYRKTREKGKEEKRKTGKMVQERREGENEKQGKNWGKGRNEKRKE